MNKLNPDFMYIKFSDCMSFNEGVEAIHSYKFEGELYDTVVPIQSPKEGSVKILLCNACGHRDFNDNGRFINEYSCNGCYRFVEIKFK